MDLRSIPRLPERQDSLTDQLRDLQSVAARLGMQDAANFLADRLNISASRSYPKLTPVQADVMRWVGKGWMAHNAVGSSVHINGKRVCNVDTMKALERHGLVAYDSAFRHWSATDTGKAWAAASDL